MSKPSDEYFSKNYLIKIDDINMKYAKCFYNGCYWYWDKILGINEDSYSSYEDQLELLTSMFKCLKLKNNDNIKTENSDTGSHYRKTIKLKVTQQECDEGYIEYQLDPYRLADIYNLNDHALFSSLKKILAAGQRGSKDSTRDIEEARDALNRKLEMIKEDKYNE